MLGTVSVDQARALLGLYRVRQRDLLEPTQVQAPASYLAATPPPIVLEPTRRDQDAMAEADVCATLERHIQRDGPRLLAVLAPYCMPGDDPVEVLKEAMRQANWEQLDDEEAT